MLLIVTHQLSDPGTVRRSIRGSDAYMIHCILVTPSIHGGNQDGRSIVFAFSCVLAVTCFFGKKNHKLTAKVVVLLEWGKKFMSGIVAGAKYMTSGRKKETQLICSRTRRSGK